MRLAIRVPALLFSAFAPPVARAQMRMPEEFDVEKDFAVKEKYRAAEPYIRCDVCMLTVVHTIDSVGENPDEDIVYDTVEKLCDAQEVFKKSELIATDGKNWEVKSVVKESRTDHEIRWQSHAMQELCDNTIRPRDDEIKDSIMKAKRGGKGGKRKEVDRETLAWETCTKMKLCRLNGNVVKQDL